MPAAKPAATPADPPMAVPSDQAVRSAFRELHGSRLYAFALLLTLGDRRVATELAHRALTAAEPRLVELRHPERAAAWLRRHVVRHGAGRATPAATSDGAAALEPLEVTSPVLAALGRLGRDERAGVIASSIEGLDQRDVATIVGRPGSRITSFLRRARRRYLASFARDEERPDAAVGPIAERVHDVAARTMR